MTRSSRASLLSVVTAIAVLVNLTCSKYLLVELMPGDEHGPQETPKKDGAYRTNISGPVEPGMCVCVPIAKIF